MSLRSVADCWHHPVTDVNVPFVLADQNRGLPPQGGADSARRARIADLADEAEYVAKGFDPWISRAPVHVVVCVSKELYLSRYSEPDKGDGSMGDEAAWPVPYWWVDAGASMMLILLIFRLVSSKNSQSYGTTIDDLWDSCDRLKISLPQKSRSKSPTRRQSSSRSWGQRGGN